MLPLALLLPPPIARNLLSAPQVRLLAKPIPQACAGCAALTPAPRSRPLAVSSRNAQAPARTELQLPRTRTISCCSRRCWPACPCKCPGLSHQGATHSPLLFPSPPLTLFAVGLPASCSIAPARRTSAAAWEITATWHVCNGDLGMVPPPAAAGPPPAFLGPNPCPASNSCALLRAAAAAAASAPSRAIRRAAGRLPPHFLAPPSAIGRKQVVSVDIADANPQHIATASVIGLQLLQVTAPAPAAFPACASRRLLRRWMPAHRGRWSPAARSGSRCTPSPPFRRVHPKSPLRTVVNVCCAAGGVGAHAHEQRQQHSRSIRCTSPAHLAALPPCHGALSPSRAASPP